MKFPVKYQVKNVKMLWNSIWWHKDITKNRKLYRVIHKYLRKFRTPLRNNQDRHSRKEHVNKKRISPSFFCVLGAVAYLQVLSLGGSRDETWRGQGIENRSLSWNLPKLPNLTSATSPRVDISSTCKVGQKPGVSLPLLTCSPSALPSRLLYRRGRKSRRDLWITLYIYQTIIQSILVYGAEVW
jgi:hypothetical protein